LELQRTWPASASASASALVLATSCSAVTAP